MDKKRSYTGGYGRQEIREKLQRQKWCSRQGQHGAVRPTVEGHHPNTE